MWRSQIVKLLQGDLFSLLCGHEWERAEAAIQRERSAESYNLLQGMVVRTQADRRTVAGALVNNGVHFNSLSLIERIELFQSLTRYAPSHAGPRWRSLTGQHGEETALWFAQFCLRMATDVQLAMWAGESLLDALGVLIEWPLTARAARCLAMASLMDAEDDEFPPLFPGWDWTPV
jgi:hypothetical protein